jgi:hypothetical protein
MEQFGVYISIRTIDGKLWSSNRETQAEVETDFANAQEWLEGHGFLGGTAAAGQTVHQTPAAAVVSDAEGLANVSSILGAPETSQTFETCRKCGVGIRDKWVPPGISKKTGKQYQGFYSCNNPSCR